MNGMENEKDRDMLESLFRHVSARERPSEEDEEAIRASLHAQWSSMTRRRKIRRYAVGLAVAATLVLALITALNRVQGPGDIGPAVQVAAVERISGSVRAVTGNGADTQQLDHASLLQTGYRITTGRQSRVAIRWHNGESLRLDENTQLHLVSEREIELLEGQVYIDTEAAPADAELTIMSALGQVRHLGTQYLTSLSADDLSVSVRAGRVQLNTPAEESVAARGEKLISTASGAHRREAVPTFGPVWQWTEELAPAFSSDGRSMADFIDWVAHESGRTAEFASREAEQLAKDTILRGNVDMDPMPALMVMMQTSDLVAEIEGGKIIIRLKAPI